MTEIIKVGKGFKEAIIKKKKPKTAKKIGELPSLNIFVQGSKKILVPKKGFKLKR